MLTRVHDTIRAWVMSDTTIRVGDTTDGLGVWDERYGNPGGKFVYRAKDAGMRAAGDIKIYYQAVKIKDFENLSYPLPNGVYSYFDDFVSETLRMCNLLATDAGAKVQFETNDPPAEQSVSPTTPETISWYKNSEHAIGDNFAQGAAFCASKNQRLCSPSQLCTDGRGSIIPSLAGEGTLGDEWILVDGCFGDTSYACSCFANHWLQIGAWGSDPYPNSYTCSLHEDYNHGVGHFAPYCPAWGQTSAGYQRLACCGDPHGSAA